jgi:o-succinylbenzoate synthase
MFFHPYTLRSRGSLNAVSTRKEFHGALIKLGEGVGCLHPWPEFGDAPIEGQLRILRDGGTSKVVERALRMAAADGVARAKGVSLFAGLEIPPCHYSWDRNQPIEGQMRMVIEEGWQAIKMKGSDKFEDTIATLEAMAGVADDTAGHVSLNDGVRFRVDFNSCLSAQQFKEFLKAMPAQVRARLDFIEDPFPYDPELWNAMREKYGARLALDKQLRGAVSGFDVAVLKPGRREWRELTVELPADVRVVMTSAMDHAIGQSFAAYEAALAWKDFGDRMDLCGLSTQHLFEPDDFFARLSATGGKFEVDRSGTGLGFDEVLKKLPWRNLE